MITNKTLREIMTNQIKSYGWLNYDYKRKCQNDLDEKRHLDYLNSLSDEDFLYTYNNLNSRIENLD